MKSRNLVIISVVAVVAALAVFGTVAYGIYAGMNTGRHNTSSGSEGAIVTGTVPGAVPGSATDVARGAQGAAANSSAFAQPARDGIFAPGGPPFGQGGAAADGLSAWGVAYREVSDANAQADSALVKSAYQDAEKKVSDLASATGVKLGKLVALTDSSIHQPYFKPCVYQGGGPALGKPVPQGNGTTGSGSAPAAGTGTAIAPVPAPVPVPCQANNNHYLVVWVYVRHAIG